MKRLALILAAGGLAGPVMAGGPATPIAEPVVVPAPAPVAVAPSGDWSGAYGGATLGWGKADGGGYKADGTVGGVQAGYRWDLGTTVLGVEGDWLATDISDSGIDVDQMARLKFSAGYDLGRTLVYATAGAAYAKARMAGVDYSDTGWFLGAGVEHALNDKWSLGGEVLAHRFNDFDGTGADVDGTTAALRVNYRF